MSNDARWPRASEWLKASGDAERTIDLAILGMPAQQTALSQTNAAATPAAIRQALARYSTWAISTETELGELSARDFGDSISPDRDEAGAAAAFAAAISASRLAIALGGDNSITFASAAGLADAVWAGSQGEPAVSAGSGSAGNLANIGLISLDAHHDFREGKNNGSWLRRLVDAGLKPQNVVQIGIADFSNSASYSLELRELGVHVITRAELRDFSVQELAARALGAIAADQIHVDFDMDICDRSVVPACPAAAPGGISADELRRFAAAFGASPKVRSADITEVDVEADSTDQRTVRLAALVILEMAKGLALRGTEN